MAASEPETGPLFIGGAERSGTTFVGAELARHAGLTFLPEALFLAPSIADDVHGRFSVSSVASSWRLRSWGPDLPTLIDGVSPGMDARECFALVVDNYRATVGGTARVGSERWVEHSPHNLRYVSELSTAYPNAVFVHVVRDGRAVYSSARRTNFGPLGPVDAANRWLRQLSWGLAAESMSPRVIRVRYEDVIRRGAEAVEEIVKEIGVEPGVEPVINVGSLTSEQHALVDNAADEARIDAWRDDLPDKSVATFEALAGPMLEMLGYQTATSSMHLSQPALYSSTFGSSAAQLLYRIPRRHLTHAAFRLSSRVRDRDLRSGRSRP